MKEPNMVGMVHFPGINDKEWDDFQKSRVFSTDSCNLTQSFRTKTEEDRMRLVMEQANEAEEEFNESIGYDHRNVEAFDFHNACGDR